MMAISPSSPVSPVSPVAPVQPAGASRSGGMGGAAAATPFFQGLAEATFDGAQDWLLNGAGADDVADLLDDFAGPHGKARGRGKAGSRRDLASLVSGLDGEDAETGALIAMLAAAGPGSNVLEMLGASGTLPGAWISALCLLLEGNKSDKERRAEFEEALAALLEDPDWALNLFASTEFGVNAASALPFIRQLHAEAHAASPDLIDWFGKLRQMHDRKRKLKVLIHALGAELNDEVRGEESLRLGAVISDLKRLLLFLGTDELCARLCTSLQIEGLDADTLMEIVLQMLGADWLTADTICFRYVDLDMSLNERIQFVKALRTIARVLPDPCFRDVDHHDQVVDVIEACGSALAELEAREQ